MLLVLVRINLPLDADTYFILFDEQGEACGFRSDAEALRLAELFGSLTSWTEYNEGQSRGGFQSR